MSSQNAFRGGPRLAVACPKTGSVAVNQGDFVKIASNLVLAIAAVADAVFGFSEDQSPAASIGDQLTEIAVLRPGPGVLSAHPLKLSDTVAYDDLVYVSSNVATAPGEISSSSANSAAKVGRVRDRRAFGATITGDGVTPVVIEFLGANA